MLHPDPAASPALAAGHLLLRDFLPAARHETLLAHVLDHREAFTPAVTAGTVQQYRRAKYLRLPRTMIDWFADPIRQGKDGWCDQLGLPLMALNAIEMYLVAYNDGDGYFLHRDDGGTGKDQERRLSFVYYFFRRPQRFRGGDLLLYGVTPAADQVPEIVAPQDNALVVFPSPSFHEVTTVQCPSQDFADGRFALVGFASGVFNRPAQ